MKSLQIKSLSVMLGSIMLAVLGTAYVNGQERAAPEPPTERSLSGQIRWKKSMGVPPKTPGSDVMAENICAQFYVAVTESSASSHEIVAYDNTLVAAKSVEPDYYLCRYEMKVPTNRNLYVRAGMGNVFMLPKPDRQPYHYTDSWIAEDGSRPVPPNGFSRVITPPYRPVVLTKKSTYVGYEMVYGK